MLHLANMSIFYIPPYTPLFDTKIGMYRYTPIFLNFDPKCRKWILVSYLVRTISVLSKNIKNIKMFLMNVFLQLKWFVYCMGRFL